MSQAIQMNAVTKTFGDTKAVDSLDLQIPSGALYGFIGPNGAGKTTSIRMIMSILFPDSGEIEILGHGTALEAKDRIGYLPEERGVYKKMRVSAYLKYIGRLKGVGEKMLDRRIEELLERVRLPEVASKRCEDLSKGMSQKIQFCAAIIHEPDLLILDEPFSGLDPVSMRLLRDQIVEEHKRGATILFSTHVMQQAEDICDHVVMMFKGRKVLDDPIASIHRRYDPRTIEFEPIDSGADITPIRALAAVEDLGTHQNGFELLLREGSDPGSVIRDVAAAVPMARIELSRPNLEDVFIQLVSEEDAGSVSELRASVRRSEAGEDAA